MSDRVAVMNLGLLEQVGSPEDIYHRPASLFVADFVGTANRFNGKIVEAAGDAYSVAIDGGVGTHRIPGPAGLANGAEVVVIVRPENLQISGGGGLRATVVDAAFLGAERTVRLNSHALGELTATSRGASAAPDRGAEVSLSWTEGDAWLIPAAE